MMGVWLDLSIENRVFRRETVVLFDGLVHRILGYPGPIFLDLCFIAIFDGIFNGIYPQTMG